MQILAVSDEVVDKFYRPGMQDGLTHIQMLLGCGDLQPSYLEYLVSMLNVPSFYVPGNHDGEPEETERGEILTAPPGWRSLDGRIVRIAGLTLAGLGGSIWYNGGKHQYTEQHMLARVVLLLPRLLLRQKRDGHRLDILVTHSPAAGIHDGPRAHRGFQALRRLIERVRPRYHLHGHIHQSYRYSQVRQTQVGPTMVVNVSPYQILEVEPRQQMPVDTTSMTD